MDIRKTLLVSEEIAADAGTRVARPIRRAAGIAVITNPCAGRFVEDLSAMFDLGMEIGTLLTKRVVDLLAARPVSYGKAAIVGVLGEMEHGAALLHPKLGRPMREAVGGGEAIIPSNVKVGAAGTSIDVPLGHKDDVWSFDHFDTMTLTVPDAPRPDEIVVVIAVADGGRPHPRVGRGRAAV
jgi:amino acid synthesis protein